MWLLLGCEEVRERPCCPRMAPQGWECPPPGQQIPERNLFRCSSTRRRGSAAGRGPGIEGEVEARKVCRAPHVGVAPLETEVDSEEVGSRGEAASG